MFPKLHRLQRSDFDLVFRQGRRIRGQSFGLIVLFSKDKNEPSKIGIVVAKKICKLAVNRNKLKRQIRNTINPGILENLPAGRKIVVMAFSMPKTSKYQDIEKEITGLFNRVAGL